MERSHVAENRIWYEPRGVAYFLMWMGLANGLLSALFGATGLIFVEGASSVAFSLTLFRWVIADVCSVAMLVPASHLLWLRRQGQLPPHPPQDSREVWGVFLAGLAIGSFVFVAPGISPAVRVGLMGMLVLPAVWSIFRLDLWVTALLLAMNSPATKPLARLSWGFRGSQTWTCHVAVAEVSVSPPRPFQACVAY